MSKAATPPSISVTAFDCPHCGAFTTQHWYKLYANQISEKERVPSFPGAKTRDRITKAKELEADQKEQFLLSIDKIMSGLVLLDRNQSGSYVYNNISNLHLSECYNCKKIAVWVHKNLTFPAQRVGVLPNTDLPDELIADFEEARAIVGSSPRGAAALMRLVVQKLCEHLGEKGKNIDDDIASLVSKGLNPLVQRALDVVRVIGNEAVHPGTIDLKDDRDTALRLFGLVNAIADQMITHPKSVQEIMTSFLPKSWQP
ncbi:DUF4145 domain-containing protein [Nitrosomonas oligotropha]|uniref:DUF4145 domain-containing protein n=1 Tax=Nitrosomonas oligotropha TaxID=42354 RepID=A0A1H8QCJ1_9PROT|nr:DUF4145 domain-containing protein [Nitrosomonas oligotropha]SDW72742.1 protein of unknown function [Nitrosomonas oligotropha]SEO51955.1 protein of unknown function [Nitrosomonas oligotropha]